MLLEIGGWIYNKDKQDPFIHLLPYDKIYTEEIILKLYVRESNWKNIGLPMHV